MLEVDEEEVEAVIDFQVSMREGALESGETEEAQRRYDRITYLRGVLRIWRKESGPLSV